MRHDPCAEQVMSRAGHIESQHWDRTRSYAHHISTEHGSREANLKPWHACPCPICWRLGGVRSSRHTLEGGGSSEHGKHWILVAPRSERWTMTTTPLTICSSLINTHTNHDQYNIDQNSSVSRLRPHRSMLRRAPPLPPSAARRCYPAAGGTGVRSSDQGAQPYWAVWHPQAKTKCPRLEFSNEMQMDYVLSQV